MVIKIKHYDNIYLQLYSFWHKIVYEDRFKNPIKIQLSEMGYYRANTFNFILIFIESLLAKNGNARIYVDLLNPDVVSMLLTAEQRGDNFYVNNSKLNEFTKNRAIALITFYISTGFVENLYKNDINVNPGPDSFQEIVKKYGAEPFVRKWKHSAKMLSLTRVIDTELDQRVLSDKVDNMATILYQNLWGRTGTREAKDAGQMMFELVKNIYQHAPFNIKSNSINNGYISAHVQKTPILKKPPLDIDLIKDLLFTKSRLKTARRYLSISINDFGIGLVKKVRDDLTLTDEKAKKNIGRFKITKEFIQDDANLILLATTTDYTTKYLDGEERFLDKKLSNKGYGYIFCMSFIAKNFGRMEVRAGTKSVLFIAKGNALFNESLNNNESAAESLQNSFNELFDLSISDLGQVCGSFPGTQTIIEIPVQAPFYRSMDR